MKRHAYQGSPDAPYPPCGDGWSYVDGGGRHYDAARDAAGSIGELPINHYTDRLTSSGLFRFFAFDTPAGTQLGALHYDGTLGQDAANDACNCNCSRWVPDASNAQATAIASSIINSNQPVAFQDQAVYNTTIEGTRWRFVMWTGDCVGDGGTYNCVSTYRYVPSFGFLGDLTDPNVGSAADDLMTFFQTTAPDTASHPEVSAFQTAYNAALPPNSPSEDVLTVDGKYGPCTQAALQAVLDTSQAGAAPQNAFGGTCGGGGGGGAPNLQTAAQNALSAINADPNYCTSVGHVGSSVNSAVHQFKLAWNNANPSNPVPINTGKYETPTAAALSQALGKTAPAACDAPRPQPSPSPQPQQASMGGVGLAALLVGAVVVVGAIVAGRGHAVR